MKPGKDFIGVGGGALIINNKNQVLLIRRTGKSQGGLGNIWARPGGAIEFGETVEDGIKREIKEELNIDIELFGPKTFENDIREEKGIKKHWIAFAYFSKIVSGELKNLEPEKHDKIEWFDLNSIPENTADFTKKHIEELKKYLSI